MSAAKKERIPFIDIMKGLCITMIVAVHIGGVINQEVKIVFQSFRVPMYYFLSGLFFKRYDNFIQFCIKKTNNIIVPFFFFFLISYLAAFVCSELFGLYAKGMMGDQWAFSYILDPFGTNGIHFGSPLWFLLSLFWTNILYYAISNFKSYTFQLITVFGISVAGYMMAEYSLTLPAYIDTAFVAIPFFFWGIMIKKNQMLSYSKYDKMGLLILPIVIILLFFPSGTEMNIAQRQLPDYFQMYIISIISILSLFFFCKNIRKKIPVLSYIGQYSLIVLGTHSLFCSPLKYLVRLCLGETDFNPIIIWLLMMLLQIPTIYLMVRLFPRFTAQKPLFDKSN